MPHVIVKVCAWESGAEKICLAEEITKDVMEMSGYTQGKE